MSDTCNATTIEEHNPATNTGCDFAPATNPQDHAYYVDMAYKGRQAEVRRQNGIVTITPIAGGDPVIFTREEFGAVTLMFGREGDTTRPVAEDDDLTAGDMG
jgi:hypothetical protein